MKKLAMFALLAAISVGLLAGCGGGGGTPTREVTVTMGDGGALKFNPDMIELKQGEVVKVNLQNKDTTTAHSFVIPDLNVKSQQVPPGKTDSVQVTAKKTGTVNFYCDVPGHKDAGMTGKVDVKS